MQEHDLRRQVVGEMHLRRWPVLTIPSIVIQWVLELSPQERAQESECLARIASDSTEVANPAHLTGRLGDAVQVSWERHSEGSSLALFVTDLDQAALDKGALPAAAQAAMDWAKAMPGRIIRATQILIVPDDAAAERLLPSLDFLRAETISCHVGGMARMWGDFRLQEDGFGRLLVAANGTDVRDFTRLVQRLQDLGNYRNRALLGLPAAQSAWPRLDQVGLRLAELSTSIANEHAKDDTLMEELSALSLELSAIANAIDYRLSATAAYAQLVEERLAQLQVSPISGFASLDGFTQRRFMPAIRTCAAVREREQHLSQRAERLASLLRARIDTRIENQNAELLRSMDKSSRLQLRLQQLVEGLSVVALSYYLIGLIGYGLKGARHVWPALDAELMLALLVIPVVGAVWFGLHTLKKRLLGLKA